MSQNSHELRRHATAVAKDVLQDAPLLVVQGARQVGKSTLLAQALDKQDAHFVTLDDPVQRDFASRDPRGFLAQAPGMLLAVDEVQRVPELALALKLVIDEDRRPGRFAVTGSSDLLRTPGVSDSLAGRAELLKVYPFSQGELAQRSDPEDWVAWVLSGAATGNTKFSHGDTVREAVLQGGYPPPVLRSNAASKSRWYESYIHSLATHDARELAGLSNFAHSLVPLLRNLAQQGQSELVKSKTARSLGISEAALAEYLELADVMYLTEAMPGWGIGFTNRAIKRPKISVADSGLASFLAGLTLNKSRLAGGAELFGAIFEGFVAGELRKQRVWSNERFDLHHFRERDNEVDIVVELADGSLILVEVKAAMGVDSRAWASLIRLSEKFGDRVVARVVLHNGPQVATINDGGYPVHVLPASTLWEHPAL